MCSGKNKEIKKIKLIKFLFLVLWLNLIMKVLSCILFVVSVAMTTAMHTTEVERIADPVY